MRKYTLLILIFVSIFSVNSFSKTEYLTKWQAIQDIDSLVKSIDEIHLDMFYTYPKDSFYEELNVIKKDLPDSLTVLQLYKCISPLIAKLEDGHTEIYFPDFALQDESLLLPLVIDVNQNDSTLNIIRDYENEGSPIPNGARIISINNINYKDMVTKMLEYCSGERIFFRLSKVSRMFRQLLFMLYPSETYRIEYVYNNEKVIQNVKAQPKSKPIYNIKKTAFSPYSLSIDEKRNTAIMDFKAFSDKSRFIIFADSVFTVLKDKKISNLIIDLRKNGGGDSTIGDELFQYISDIPFNQFSKTITKVSPLYKKLSNNNKQKDGIYEHTLHKDFELIPLRENPLRFNGKVYVLISHMTFSSAASFSWTFQKLGMGKIIGEESGGLAICYGNVVMMNLPYSNLKTQISFAQMFEYGANDEDVHGTIPDIEVPEAKALEYTLKLIEENKF